MDENKLIKLLIATAAILIVLNIVNIVVGEPSWQITRFIALELEGNFQVWFSSMLLAIAAFFAYKCSLVANIAHDEKKIWQLFGIGLLGMSCDETAQIHEHLGNVVNKYIFGIENISSAWVVLLGPIALVILLLFAVKMKKYLKGSIKATKFLIAGTLLYILGGFLFESTTNFLDYHAMRQLWTIEVFLEEGCEMFGVILIIKGLVEHHKFMKARLAFRDG